LPSSYIHAHFPSADFTRKVIKNLGKAQLIRVPRGYQHNNAHYRPRPLELTDLGRKELAKIGLLRDRMRMNNHFAHGYLRTVIDYSFRRAPAEIPDLVLHTERDILNHPNTPEAVKTDPNPSWFESGGHVVRPDAPLFGFESRGAHIYFHGFEAEYASKLQYNEHVSALGITEADGAKLGIGYMSTGMHKGRTVFTVRHDCRIVGVLGTNLIFPQRWIGPTVVALKRA
jgi:hypothetical protein